MSGKPRINLTGQRFVRWTVKESVGKSAGNTLYKCICDCGTERVVFQHNLVSGRTKSCGCYIADYHRTAKKTHGMSKTKFYKVFKSMEQRCNDKSSVSYRWYGGRGIKCYWKTFDEFSQDMHTSYMEHVEKYGEKNTTIDRIDVNGDYKKENCRWASMKEQIENRRYRRTEFYKIDGLTMTINEICKKYDINRSMFSKRLRNGWNVKKAIKTPPKKTLLRKGI